MALDLNEFRGSPTWEFTAKNSPYYLVKEKIRQHIIETGFTGVKTHKFLTLKQYWLSFIKNAGMPIDDAEGMRELRSDLWINLSEDRTLRQSISQFGITMFEQTLYPEMIEFRTRKRRVGYYDAQHVHHWMDEYTGKRFDPRAVYDEDDVEKPADKPEKRKRKKKGETGLEELLGLDNMPALF